MPERRALIAGAVMLLAAASIPLVEPHRWLARELPPLRLESAIPNAFGDWHLDTSIAPVLPSPDVQAQLDVVYSQVLSRTYADSAGHRVMLVIAYGEDQLGKATVAHLPDACYPAQGFTISARPTRPVRLAEGKLGVSRLVATKSVRIEPITYWSVVGDRTFASDNGRRVTRLDAALSGVIPDGMLVRVSSVDANEDRAFAAEDDFIRSLNDDLRDSVRHRIFGLKS